MNPLPPVSDFSDPRVYFAAERTLLAWLRTGIAVIGLGFVVGRFGLFLRMMRHGSDPSAHLSSTLIGLGLILLGAIASGVATWQHMRFFQGLGAPERPRRYWMPLSILFGFALTAIAIALAGHLVLRAMELDPSDPRRDSTSEPASLQLPRAPSRAAPASNLHAVRSEFRVPSSEF